MLAFCQMTVLNKYDDNGLVYSLRYQTATSMGMLSVLLGAYLSTVCTMPTTSSTLFVRIRHNAG